MATSKIAISMDPKLLAQLDRLVKRKAFRSRSHAVQTAVRERIDRMEQARLARECAKLDPDAERALADEGLSEDVSEWPEY